MNDQNSGSILPKLIMRREGAYTHDAVINYSLMHIGDSFSVEISLVEDGVTTVERLDSISDSAEDARTIFEMLALGSVPPYCAAEVVEDMLESGCYRSTADSVNF